MNDVIPLEEAQISESAYVWTNSKKLQMVTTVRSSGTQFYGLRWQFHYTKSLDKLKMTHTGTEFIKDYAR
jgi:hypothetical protein